MRDSSLFRLRVTLVQQFLEQQNCDAVLLGQRDNFAMVTGGRRNYISTHASAGAGALLVTRDGTVHCISNNIEADHLREEELAGYDCTFHTFPWHEDTAVNVARKLVSGTVVSDDGSLGHNVHGALAYVRSLLSPDELERYRRLGRLAAEAMEATLQSIERGTTEGEIAAEMHVQCACRRCHLPVVLVAADDRVARYRHALPTAYPVDDRPDTPVRDYVMVSAGVSVQGLTVSLTRFKRVGESMPDVEDAHRRICAVDAAFQEATRPGRTLGEVFRDGQAAYASQGFASDEWRHHHQGGPTGYSGRTCKAMPNDTFPILDAAWREAMAGRLGRDEAWGQAFAWNPSAPGVKSEDTFLLLADGATEIVTATPGLPAVDLATMLGRDTEVVKSGMVVSD